MLGMRVSAMTANTGGLFSFRNAVMMGGFDSNPLGYALCVTEYPSCVWVARLCIYWASSLPAAAIQNNKSNLHSTTQFFLKKIL